MNSVKMCIFFYRVRKLQITKFCCAKNDYWHFSQCFSSNEAFFAMNFYICGTEMTGKSKQQIYNSFFQAETAPVFCSQTSCTEDRTKVVIAQEKIFDKLETFLQNPSRGQWGPRGPFVLGSCCFWQKDGKNFGLSGWQEIRVRVKFWSLVILAKIRSATKVFQTMKWLKQN